MAPNQLGGVSPEITLEIQYTHHAPIELGDLTASLDGFADEFRKTLKRVGTKFEDDKTRLFVREIRSGSIIASLVPMAPYAQAIVANASHLVEFAAHFRESLAYLSGVSKTLSHPFEKKNLVNLDAIVTPTAKEANAAFVFAGPDSNGAPQKTEITTSTARTIRRNVKVALDEMSAPSTQVVTGIQLHWYQARNDRFSHAGDRGIVDELSDRPVKVQFADDAIKREMLLGEANPFQMVYDVDLVVDLIGRKPTLYRIIKYHGSKLAATTSGS